MKREDFSVNFKPTSGYETLLPRGESIMKRFASYMILFLLLINALAIIRFNIKPSKGWTGTVYIRADGNIDPPDAPIITYDKITYTLTGNIASSADGIVVERDNIILDGACYTIQGTGEYPYKGVDLSDRSNVTVKNIIITTFYYGVYLYSSYLYYSSNNVISGNNITNNKWIGVYLYYSSNNVISGNSIVNNVYGVCLSDSSNNAVTGNVFINSGLFVYNTYGNVVVDNTVNGKPLVYFEGVSDRVVEDAGQVILVNCNRITVKNLNLFNTTVGAQLWNTHNTTISKNNITNNCIYGIYLRFSSKNNLCGNNITNNNYFDGICLDHSSNNIIGGNSIVNNVYGVCLSDSSNNVISGNSIVNNVHGVDLWYSSNNTFYHNNFINNAIQVSAYDAGANVWDDGYPSGGNYWSGYASFDEKCGPGQDLPGSDGVGDTPYSIDVVNVDNYPLFAPITIFDVGVWYGVSYHIDIVTNSTVLGLCFNPYEGPLFRFNVTGDDGTVGFCRVAVPKTLLWVEDGWTITVGDQPITKYLELEDKNFTYLYFTYNHSIQTITIRGTHVIPEFPLAIQTLITLTLATLITTIWKIRGKRKLTHFSISRC